MKERFEKLEKINFELKEKLILERKFRDPKPVFTKFVPKEIETDYYKSKDDSQNYEKVNKLQAETIKELEY